MARPCAVSVRLAPAENECDPQITIEVAHFSEGPLQTVVRSIVWDDRLGFFTTTIDLPRGTHQVWISSDDSAASSMVVVADAAAGLALEFDLRG